MNIWWEVVGVNKVDLWLLFVKRVYGIFYVWVIELVLVNVNFFFKGGIGERIVVEGVEVVWVCIYCVYVEGEYVVIWGFELFKCFFWVLVGREFIFLVVEVSLRVVGKFFLGFVLGEFVLYGEFWLFIWIYCYFVIYGFV